MPRDAFLITRLRRDQRGFTLVELLVAMPLALLLVFAALNLYRVAANGQSATGNRSEAVQSARSALERMTRELRQVGPPVGVSLSPVRFTSSQVMDYTTWTRPAGGTSVQRNVRYDCSEGRCMRSEGPVGGALGTPALVVDGVQNLDVFDPRPDVLYPDYVAIKLNVRVKGQSRPITVTDGVALRNAGG
jgi:prepilin-type N-terminal cleavage/methylation domain-containing protein